MGGTVVRGCSRYYRRLPVGQCLSFGRKSLMAGYAQAGDSQGITDVFALEGSVQKSISPLGCLEIDVVI